jgi:hypothetical protein
MKTIIIMLAAIEYAINIEDGVAITVEKIMDALSNRLAIIDGIHSINPKGSWMLPDLTSPYPKEKGGRTWMRFTGLKIKKENVITLTPNEQKLWEVRVQSWLDIANGVTTKLDLSYVVTPPVVPEADRQDIFTDKDGTQYPIIWHASARGLNARVAWEVECSKCTTKIKGYRRIASKNGVIPAITELQPFMCDDDGCGNSGRNWLCKVHMPSLVTTNQLIEEAQKPTYIGQMSVKLLKEHCKGLETQVQLVKQHEEQYIQVIDELEKSVKRLEKEVLSIVTAKQMVDELESYCQTLIVNPNKDDASDQKIGILVRLIHHSRAWMLKVTK